MRTERTLHLGYMYWSNGSHPAGWRLPEASDDAFDVGQLERVAALLEAGTFDFVFFGDRVATGPQYAQTNTSTLARLEPLTMAAYLAHATTDLGIIVTVNTTYYDPFTVARLAASLDHLSGGRIGLNLVTGRDRRAALNFSRERHGESEERYARAEEFVEVLLRLWDSWQPGALPRNKATGEFLDVTKVHPINFAGKHFQVRGPLTSARSPQQRPPLVHAGASPQSQEFGARWADVLFLAQFSLESATAYAEQARARAAAAGRDPSELVLLPGFTAIVGSTRQEARDLYDRLNSLLTLDDDPILGGRSKDFWLAPDAEPLPTFEGKPLGLRNLGALSRVTGVDFTDRELGSEIGADDARRFTAAGSALLHTVALRTGRGVGHGQDRPAQVADLLYAYVVDGHFVAGTAEDIADYIQAWFEAGGSDGFFISSPALVGQLERFVTEVVPILRRRGLFRTRYGTRPTLRATLGLPDATPCYFPDQRAHTFDEITEGW